MSEWVVGVDEVGRGPWAGPVTAGAVLLNPMHTIAGLADSKKLSERRRDVLAPVIREAALAWSVVHVSVEEIDSCNILQATLLAMRRALLALVLPSHVSDQHIRIQVDGNHLPNINGLPFPCSAQAIIGGDALVPAISAASILAKTTRDALMVELDRQYPGYGLARHKGYGTAEHMKALRTLGVAPIHRRSFAPVRELLVAGAVGSVSI